MAWAISRSYSFFPGIFHVYMKYMLINFFFFSCYSFITRGGGDSANNSEGLLLLLLFSHSVVFNSLWPHRLQHARLPCPSPTSGIYPNSCPLHQWCHPTILSSVVPFSSCLQSFPASGSSMSQFLASSGHSIGASASAEYSGMISYRIDWLILLVVQGTLKSLLQHHSSKASILWCSAFFIVQLSHPYLTTLEKP